MSVPGEADLPEVESNEAFSAQLVADDGQEVEGQSAAEAPAKHQEGAGRTLVNTALIVATVAALVLTALLGRTALQNRNDDRRTDDAVAAAKKLVVAITSVNKDSMATDVKAILEQSTGTFKDQFTTQQQAYLEAVTKAAVTSKGSIVEAGIVSSSKDEVVVLVAASSTISNPKIPAGDKRVYRMKVTVVPRGGKWLISKLELVA